MDFYPEPLLQCDVGTKADLFFMHHRLCSHLFSLHHQYQALPAVPSVKRMRICDQCNVQNVFVEANHFKLFVFYILPLCSINRSSISSVFYSTGHG